MPIFDSRRKKLNTQLSKKFYVMSNLRTPAYLEYVQLYLEVLILL